MKTLNDKLMALLAARDRASREPRGTVVLGEGLTRSAGTDAKGTLVFGTREDELGEPLVFARSMDPAPTLAPVAVLGCPDPPPDGLVCLDVDRRAATLDGRPMRVVSADPRRYRDRVLAVPGIDGLRDRRALIVGCGSVGSDIGARLASLGVRVIAADPDVLSMENLIRWGIPVNVADDVGRRKVLVWERRLRASVPSAAVRGVPMDVVRDPGGFDALLDDERPDLIVVATDTRDSRRAASLAAARHRLPALFVALSDGAKTCRLELVESSSDGPCHLCSSANEDGASPERTERRSLTPYATEEPSADTAVPALPLNVAMANALTARVVVSFLAGAGWRQWFRRGEQEGSVMFMSLEPASWVFDEPWMRLVYQPERVPGCAVCGRDEEVTHA